MSVHEMWRYHAKGIGDDGGKPLSLKDKRVVGLGNYFLEMVKTLSLQSLRETQR